MKAEFRKELINLRNSLRDKIKNTEESIEKQFVAVVENANSKDELRNLDGSVDRNGVPQNINELDKRIENIEVHLNKDTAYDQLSFEVHAQRAMIEKIQIESHQQATIIEEQTKSIENLGKKPTKQHEREQSSIELREEVKSDRGLAASQVPVTPTREGSFAAAVKYKSQAPPSEGHQTERVRKLPSKATKLKRTSRPKRHNKFTGCANGLKS